MPSIQKEIEMLTLSTYSDDSPMEILSAGTPSLFCPCDSSSGNPVRYLPSQGANTLSHPAPRLNQRIDGFVAFVMVMYTKYRLLPALARWTNDLNRVASSGWIRMAGNEACGAT